ncbi:hypothetical protein VTK56DRAFT_1482 [Thermocarpiscus australiensis]
MSDSVATEADHQSGRGARKRSRQNPGPACQQCRLRKLRCDRQTPCNGCVDAGVECHVDTTPPQRGPRKGHLQTLRLRIAALERHIGFANQCEGVATTAWSSQDPDDDVEEDHDLDWEHKQRPEHAQPFRPVGSRTPPSPLPPPPPPPPPSDIAAALPAPVDMPCAIDTAFDDMEMPIDTIPLPPPLNPVCNTLGSLVLDADQLISPLTRADLDQLYFDRIHSSVPVIHQRHYLQRSKVVPPTPSHRCLQYAMWTMASAMSSQFHHLRDLLYCGTVDQLHALDSRLGAGLCPLDEEASLLAQAQAWILVAVYEFVKLASSFRRPWTSVGRAIRLVQLLRLNEMDASDGVFDIDVFAEKDHDAVIEMEERRRTFWMAFCLDRFACAMDGLPQTLAEPISTRLPCSEHAFDSATSVVMPLLWEVMDDTDTGSSALPLSPWVECIVFSTLWGRTLAHQQQSKQECLHRPVAAAFCERQVWLDELLTRRMQVFQQRYPPGTVRVDSMLLFTSMIAQAAVLSLCKAISDVPPTVTECAALASDFRQRAPAAVKDMVRLMSDLAHFSSFKIHPFTPIPLRLCRLSLLAVVGDDPSLHDLLDTITKALHELKDVNNLCHYGLDVEEPSVYD